MLRDNWIGCLGAVVIFGMLYLGAPPPRPHYEPPPDWPLGMWVTATTSATTLAIISSTGGGNVACVSVPAGVWTNIEPVRLDAGIKSGEESQRQDSQSPFFNPVWLFALLLGWLGIYVAVVVSDNYGPGAFFFGLLLMGSGFFIGVFADDTLTWLIRHLASANCCSENVETA